MDKIKNEPTNKMTKIPPKNTKLPPISPPPQKIQKYPQKIQKWPHPFSPQKIQKVFYWYFWGFIVSF